MDKETRARFEARAAIVKAMAHPTRLFMVDALSRKERCVCELRDMVGSDMSTVSKHLSVLKNAGIVMDEKRGSQVFYGLRCPCVLSFFSCVESVLKAAPRYAGARAERRLLRRRTPVHALTTERRRSK